LPVAQYVKQHANYPIVGIKQPRTVDHFLRGLDRDYETSKWPTVGVTPNSLLPIRLCSEGGQKRSQKDFQPFIHGVEANRK